MEATFLGTSGTIPTTQRNPSAILLRREGERLLFDVGEGTQRQMMRFSTGFDVSTIFLTHLHGDHVLGLPGLLQTLDFNERTAPLHIYTPSGISRDVEHLLEATGTTPDYRVQGHDTPPGETIIERDGYTIHSFKTDHRTRSVGYALVEDERKGRFDRERAEELGVPVGPKFQQLHEDASVELENGTVVQPKEVVGEPRPGRRVVYTGDTRPTGSVVSVASNADLLIHDSMFAHERSERAQYTAIRRPNRLPILLIKQAPSDLPLPMSRHDTQTMLPHLKKKQPRYSEIMPSFLTMETLLPFHIRRSNSN